MSLGYSFPVELKLRRASSQPQIRLWNENTKWEWHILDVLRVPVILDPALLDLINDSPTTSGFTLQSKVDILFIYLSVCNTGEAGEKIIL
jgi:hypothetical protein